MPNEELIKQSKDVVARGQAMLEQTKAEGAKPFAGSRYDVPATTTNPIAPTTPTTPQTPVAAPRYNVTPTPTPTYQSEDEIRRSLDAQLSASLGAIRSKYATLKGEAVQAGKQQLGRTRAGAAASGVLGSTFGEAELGAQEQKNLEAQRLLEEQQATEESQARYGIDEATRKRFVEEREYAGKESDRQLAALEKTASSARENIKNIATTSRFDDIPTSTVESLFTQSGFSTPEEFKSFFEAARQAATKKNVELKEMKDGGWVKFTTDPITGEITTDQVVKAPPVEKKVQEVDLGNRVSVIDSSTGTEMYSYPKGVSPDKLADIKAKAIENAALVTTPEKALDQIGLVESSLARAKELAGASGRSGARRTVEGILVGSTNYTNLVAETNTLRTNVLTLMTDPTIKKFFGPQMSNADVQLMTSAGTTLNPELQSPENMKAELKRLDDLIARAKSSVKQGLKTTNGGSTGQDIESQKQQLRDAGYTDEQINQLL